MKEKTYKILIALAIMIPVLLGFSYAFFTLEVFGDPSNIQGNTSSFIINLVTDNAGYIDATDVTLIKEADIASKAEKAFFSVETGNNKNNISYDLVLTELVISENLQVDDFKWELIYLNDQSSQASGTFAGVNGNRMTLKDGLIIGANKVNNYELRIWLTETDVNQINLLGGSFRAKVTLEATMIYGSDIKNN